MFEFLWFLFFLIEQYTSYIIIPTTNFQQVSFPLKRNYSEYILSYNYIGVTDSSYSSISIRIFSSEDMSLYIYAYDNFTKLIEDGNNFTNYIKKSYLITFDDFLEFTINNYKNKTFYFSFENKLNASKNNDITCVVYSTETFTIIPQIITSKILFTQINKAFSYLFKIEKNHKKNLLFGFEIYGTSTTSYLKIFEENNPEVKYSSKDHDLSEDY